MHGQNISVVALLLLNLALVPARTARAHDMWLVPSSFVVEPNERVAVRLMIGHTETAEAVVRDSRRIVRFDHVAGGRDPSKVPTSEMQVDEVKGVDGHDPAGHLRSTETGALAVVYESNAAYSELPAAAFEAYLLAEGLETVLAARRRLGEEAKPGRELYSRSLKSLIRVGAGAGGVDRPVGLPLELVLDRTSGSGPLPSNTAPSDTAAHHLGETADIHDVALRLLWHGEPLAGVLVDLVSLDGHSGQGGPGAETFALRSGTDGTVRGNLTAGRWLASCVHAERATGAEASRAEWRSVFASLTFVVEGP